MLSITDLKVGDFLHYTYNEETLKAGKKVVGIVEKFGYSEDVNDTSEINIVYINWEDEEELREHCNDDNESPFDTMDYITKANYLKTDLYKVLTGDKND